jgi:hypothetical protein
VSAPLWVAELAGQFWAAAGGEESFPRDLLRPLHRALPLTVKELPRLRVASALDWLGRQGVRCDLGVRDRPLRACLVARGDTGFVFLDAGDGPAERRFSLAHELAHFLRDYWQPRRRAERHLGPGVLEVYDGRWPPSPDERLAELLRGVPLAFHTHLMARDAGALPRGAAGASEREVKRLVLGRALGACQVPATFLPGGRQPTRRKPFCSSRLCRVRGPACQTATVFPHHRGKGHALPKEQDRATGRGQGSRSIERGPNEPQ